MTDNEKTSSEKFTVSGDDLVEKVKQLVHEGNIRRVRVIHDDKAIFDIPLSIGAPAAAVLIMAAPVLADHVARVLTNLGNYKLGPE